MLWDGVEYSLHGMNMDKMGCAFRSTKWLPRQGRGEGGDYVMLFWLSQSIYEYEDGFVWMGFVKGGNGLEGSCF